MTLMYSFLCCPCLEVSFCIKYISYSPVFLFIYFSFFFFACFIDFFFFSLYFILCFLFFLSFVLINVLILLITILKTRILYPAFCMFPPSKNPSSIPPSILRPLHFYFGKWLLTYISVR